MPGATYLILEDLRGGTARELGRTAADEVIIGREPGEGNITAPSQAVSRQHAKFERVRSHWIFSDMGSTNGSWVNGAVVRQGSRRVVRSGDIVQLADLIIRVSEAKEGGAGGLQPQAARSLLVFSRDALVDEYPVPEYGRALVIGGPQCDLEIEGEMQNTPSMIIERKGMETSVFAVARAVPLSVNGSEIKDQAVLRDGDEVAVSYYTILFNDPISATETGASSKITDRDWSSSKSSVPSAQPVQGGGGFVGRGPTSSVFGRPPDDQLISAEETVAIDASEVEARLAVRDAHPGARFAVDEGGPRFSIDSLEEKLTVLVGFGLLLALMVLLILWLFM